MPLHLKTIALLKRLKDNQKNEQVQPIGKSKKSQEDNELIDRIFSQSSISTFSQKEVTGKGKVIGKTRGKGKGKGKKCVACSGSGISSKGKECYPCHGTGKEGTRLKRINRINAL